MKKENTPKTEEKKKAAAAEAKKNESAEAKKAEAAEAKSEEAEEDGEVNADDLFKHRVSISPQDTSPIGIVSG